LSAAEKQTKNEKSKKITILGMYRIFGERL